MTTPNYLAATLEYLPASEVGTRKPASMTAKGDPAILDRMLAEMKEQGYAILSVKVDTLCGECFGDGKVQDKRRKSDWYKVKCKSCKGHEGPLNTVIQ